MKLSRTVVAVALSLALAACASAPANLAFNAEGGGAFMVMAIPSGAGNYVNVFRRVDMGTKQFVGDAVWFEIDIGNPNAPPNQLNADNAQRPVALGYQLVPPGDYVLVEMFQALPSTNPYEGPVRTLCTHNVAPIFSLRPGAVSVVRIDELYPSVTAPADSVVLEEFARARTNYPSVGGEASIAQPMSWATWEEGPSGPLFSNRRCGEPNTFSLRDPPPGWSSTGKP